MKLALKELIFSLKKYVLVDLLILAIIFMVTFYPI